MKIEREDTYVLTLTAAEYAALRPALTQLLTMPPRVRRQSHRRLPAEPNGPELRAPDSSRNATTVDEERENAELLAAVGRGEIPQLVEAKKPSEATTSDAQDAAADGKMGGDARSRVL